MKTKKTTEGFMVVVVGIVVVIAVSVGIFYKVQQSKEATVVVDTEKVGVDEENINTTSVDVRKIADAFVTALASQDFDAMARAISSKGVRVSHYTNVSNADIKLTPTQLTNAKSDIAKYKWGYSGGSGLPIESTISDYFSKTINSHNYATSKEVYVNEFVFGSGQGGVNLKEFYPGATFVEYYLPSTETGRWSALILVFEQENASYKLVGISRGYWTI